MHFKSREAVHRALQTGVLTFATVKGDVITCRRTEISSMTYVDDGLNVHTVVVHGKKQQVTYKDFAKIKHFLEKRDPSKDTDPWFIKTQQAARR